MVSNKDIATRLLIIAGASMLVVGIIIGFLPVGGRCGSAFSAPNPFIDGAAGCDVFRGEAVRSTWQLIIGGVLLLLWTPLVGGATPSRVSAQRPAQSDPAQSDPAQDEA